LPVFCPPGGMSVVWHTEGAATSPEQTVFSSPVFEAAKLAAGARFLKADLQVHTPLDPRFEPRPTGNDKDARAATARNYLQAAKDRGVELVAIPEHNDVSWIDELRYAANGLELHMLPGFEVESSEGIHVLCIFNSTTKTVDLEDSLARLGLTKEKRTEQKRLELRADLDFAGLVTFVQEDCGGICCCPHGLGQRVAFVRQRRSASRPVEDRGSVRGTDLEAPE